MNEITPDAPDWDEYEAEQVRMHRLFERMTALYEREEMIGEEKEIENAGNQFISGAEKRNYRRKLRGIKDSIKN